ncbi:ethylbenzene dehydrogenase-related protein [Pseudoalteromonas sp. DL2-H2.2]|uniref:ethylbenzene dehydrogenase-related protein n=1 Tax=Pseudoalteromonas sp. DL2-H2.2 TaxID=2908889 RepID=UPI001F2A113A|nr:ethylbenzene dehydrogenase-related protein [Pseudoalteromonas sp. DL2-H2.2]MCF2909222.1 ethylbenzene dehydrogenase-related protein [Pseudoalteromonas sp. DL2-H2.2]
MRRVTFVLLHALVIVLVLCSLFTGLRFSLLTQDWLMFISPLLPQGDLYPWHLASGSILSVLATAYLLLSLWRPYRSNPDLYHLWVNRLGYVVIVCLICSGWFLWAGQFVRVMQPMHFYSLWLLLLYLVIHGWIYFIQHGKHILSALLPKRLEKQGLSLLAGVCITGFLLFTATRHSTEPLQVAHLGPDEFIEIDGKGNEAHWMRAPVYTIETHGGANFDDGRSTIHVQALANQYESYFLIRWTDPSQSTHHLPLLKTQNGWKVQQDGFYRFDERTFYEDKLAVMLSPSCISGADSTTYLGKRPLQGKPPNWHGKGFHASMDGEIRDLWHWKAVRTNDMYLADDNFFGLPAKVQQGQRRYSAGYQPDGKESGAYVMNWQWYTPNAVIPKRLPDPKNADLSVLPWFGSAPYLSKNDKYPPGSTLSSILYRSNRFEGDRADVRARGLWDKGMWTLELVRKHETGSVHDVALKNGTCMWFSAFDHAQIAHTRHIRPAVLRYSL